MFSYEPQQARKICFLQAPGAPACFPWRRGFIELFEFPVMVREVGCELQDGAIDQLGVVGVKLPVLRAKPHGENEEVGAAPEESVGHASRR